jgi:hypothetical protein
VINFDGHNATGAIDPELVKQCDNMAEMIIEWFRERGVTIPVGVEGELSYFIRTVF